MPEISVILPVHNGEKYLKEAVESILGQTFTDFELIIIDDGSTDSTADIVKSFDDERIVYLKNETNVGISDTMNRGIAVSKGRYIARMDADDISLPTRFEKQINYMKQNSDISVLGCAIEIFGEEIEGYVRRFSCNNDDIRIDLIFSTPFAHPTLMFDRCVFEYDRYDSSFNGLEDYELWLRFAQKYKMSVMPEVLFKYRKHIGQVTKNYSKDYIEKLKILKIKQAESFGINFTPQEFSAYFDYCLGEEIKDTKQICSLATFLSGIAESEYIENTVQKKVFVRTLNSIIIKALLGVNAGLKECRCIRKRTTDFSVVRFYIEKVKGSIRNVGRK